VAAAAKFNPMPAPDLGARVEKLEHSVEATVRHVDEALANIARELGGISTKLEPLPRMESSLRRMREAVVELRRRVRGVERGGEKSAETSGQFIALRDSVREDVASQAEQNLLHKLAELKERLDKAETRVEKAEERAHDWKKWAIRSAVGATVAVLGALAWVGLSAMHSSPTASPPALHEPVISHH